MSFVDKWQWPYGWHWSTSSKRTFSTGMIIIGLISFYILQANLVLYQVDHIIEAQVNGEPEVAQHIEVEPISQVI